MWKWLMDAWSFIKTHKKKAAALVAAIIAGAEALGYTGLAGYATKIMGWLGGGGAPI